MQKWLAFALISLAAASMGQTSSKYQPGTVMAVTTHPNGPGKGSDDAVSYDVSIKVGDITYVVLYTPPNGANSVKYSVGIEFLVLVGTDTLTINTALSRPTTLPILRREPPKAQSPN